MEALPITYKVSDDYSKYIYSKNKNIEINNESYILKIGRDPDGNNMVIFIESSNSLSNKLYKGDFSFESLIQISKHFKIFDTIEEVINSLNQIFDADNKNYSFNLENNKIIVEIEVNSFNTKNLIKLELFEQQKKIEQIEILKQVKKLNETILKMQNEFSEKMQFIENENKLLKDKINLIENENKLLKDKINIFEKTFVFNSQIIKDKSSLNFVFEHLRKIFPISTKIEILSKLIYRASKDGPTPAIYHNKCNGIPNTLCLIKTTKDVIFGGYVNIKLVGGDIWGNNYEDKDAFVFSLNKKKIYLPNNKYCLHFNENYGPIFGNCPLGYIFLVNKGDNFFKNGGYTCAIKENAYNGFTKDYEINEGEKDFIIKEIEVYQLFF